MKTIYSLLLGLLPLASWAQVTIETPQASPLVSTTWRVGLTDVEITYSSPSARGRDVVNQVIETYERDGIAWRAGANGSTVLSLSTDATLNGVAVPAGAYSFHVLIEPDAWTALLSENTQMWGSYYLDVEEDVAYRLPLQPVTDAADTVEHLTYELTDRSENTLDLSLSWGTLRIPVQVQIDLNATVMAHYAEALTSNQGYNVPNLTAAANWALDHDADLAQAEAWATQAVEGGFRGYRATRNFATLSTLARVMTAKGNADRAAELMKEAFDKATDPYQVHSYANGLLSEGNTDKAQAAWERLRKDFPDFPWSYWGLSQVYEAKGDLKKSIAMTEKCLEVAPESYTEFLTAQLQRRKEALAAQ